MIGLDTNVLVRYLIQDDARQSAQAKALIKRAGCSHVATFDRKATKIPGMLRVE